MNLHTQFVVKPGVYRGHDGEIYVVKSILTHDYMTKEKLDNPKVILEPMIQNVIEHRAFQITEEEFLCNFSAL